MKVLLRHGFRRSLALIRTMSHESANEVYSVQRKNVTDKSFEEKNKQYLSHPKSSVKSRYVKIDKRFEKLLNNSMSVIKQALLAEVMNSSHMFHQPYPSHSPDQIVFLTKEELDVANENAQRRCAEILDSDPIPSSIRPDISQAEVKDPGLAWLYESQITFVDCGKAISDQDRYMVTRYIDGTLTHISHPERDVIQGSFFKKPDQIYPPYEFLESDQLFLEILSSDETDKLAMLDALQYCYAKDHPKFQQRFNQITDAMLNDTGLMDTMILSSHFLPMLERALTDKHHDVSMLISHLHNTGRSKIAAEITSVMYYNDDRTCKQSEQFMSGQVHVTNMRAVKVTNERKRMFKKNEDIIRASLICDVDVQDIKNVKAIDTPEGKAFIVTMRDAEVAENLHNSGRGNCQFYDSNKFEFFPVKKG